MSLSTLSLLRPGTEALSTMEANNSKACNLKLAGWWWLVIGTRSSPPPCKNLDKIFLFDVSSYYLSLTNSNVSLSFQPLTPVPLLPVKAGLQGLCKLLRLGLTGPQVSIELIINNVCVCFDIDNLFISPYKYHQEQEYLEKWPEVSVGPVEEERKGGWSENPGVAEVRVHAVRFAW